jgi:hypothetical protein
MAISTDSNDMSWLSIRDGVWLGRADGRLAGLIEARNDGYLASNRDSSQFTLCATLDEAKAAFTA